jgi:hypothetical protein
VVGRHHESCRAEAFLKHMCFNFDRRFVTQEVAKNKAHVKGTETEYCILCTKDKQMHFNILVNFYCIALSRHVSATRVDIFRGTLYGFNTFQ